MYINLCIYIYTYTHIVKSKWALSFEMQEPFVKEELDTDVHKGVFAV